MASIFLQSCQVSPANNLSVSSCRNFLYTTSQHLMGYVYYDIKPKCESLPLVKDAKNSPNFRLKKKLDCPERCFSHPAIAHEFSAQTCFTVHRLADSFLWTDVLAGSRPRVLLPKNNISSRQKKGFPWISKICVMFRKFFLCLKA